MIYVFDTSSFIVLGHYFPQRFPSFWQNLDQAVADGEVLSVREVLNELKGRGNKPHLDDWIKANGHIFQPPSSREAKFVRRIFEVAHFRQLVSERARLKGTPVADPFVIAAAKVRSGTVVTEETHKPHAARIPNVCDHFNIPWTSIEGFMEHMGWKF
jgi:hypothetical protein